MQGHIYINKNFFELSQFNYNKNFKKKLNFELDINLLHQNNKFLIIHNIFMFHNNKLIQSNSTINLNKKELLLIYLTNFKKCSIIFPKYFHN